MSVETRNHGDVFTVELHYPRTSGPSIVEVGLTDVRAADSIQVQYDFERDGWTIKQATRFIWPIGETPDSGWVEVAFVQAWAMQQDTES